MSINGVENATSTIHKIYLYILTISFGSMVLQLY
uniref:Uncharacterized protein n=1 Tax=Rhizophora mucronata TaxID=61149 RepID=A0A2P2QH77_RHIMU